MTFFCLTALSLSGMARIETFSNPEIAMAEAFSLYGNQSVRLLNIDLHSGDLPNLPERFHGDYIIRLYSFSRKYSDILTPSI
jgi:hypothetical protein